MDEPPPQSKLPPIASVVEEAFAAWMWLDARVASFPALARGHLGHRMLDATLDALSATTEAQFVPRGRQRLALLTHVNRKLSLLRILLRGARERRHISVDQHEHASRLIDSWGRQIGGWLRAENQRKEAP
jgi:hypothetical protein